MERNKNIPIKYKLDINALDVYSKVGTVLWAVVRLYYKIQKILLNFKNNKGKTDVLYKSSSIEIITRFKYTTCLTT